MEKLYICKECEKPDPKKVRGKARTGKKLLNRLRGRTDLGVEIASCECLGECKKGPNGLIMPGRRRVHRLSVRKIKAMLMRK